MKDETGSKPIADGHRCLQLIRDTLKVVKVEYKEAEKILKRFYNDLDMPH